MVKYEGHMGDCAINDEGPCTCGTEEVLAELALEEDGPTAEDYE
jgi:superfamily II RNA helicase